MSQSSEEIVKISCAGKELTFFAPDGEDHIQRFLLELGTGFAFVGRQVPLEVGGRRFSGGFAVLSPEASMLCGDRTQGGGF
jgi:hypothetical protein